MKTAIVSGDLPRYFCFGDPTVLSTITTQLSKAIYKESPFSTFQAIVTGTGTVGATVIIYGSNEVATGEESKANWVVLGTITLTGTTTNTDGFTTIAPWRYVAANVTAVSGTGATVEVVMGV